MATSSISNYNGTSAYSLKPNGIDTREMNGSYTPNAIDTSNLVWYYDPANPDCYSGTGTNLTSLFGSNTSTLQGGYESNYNPVGYFSNDGVNDYNLYDAFTIGNEYTFWYWFYPQRNVGAEQYVFDFVGYGSTQFIGFRADVGFGTGTWQRLVLYYDTGIYGSIFAGNRPDGNWYMGYLSFKSGQVIRYGFTNTSGVLEHLTNSNVFSYSGSTTATLNRYGMGSPATTGTSRFGEHAFHNVSLTNAQLDRIHENTKQRYGW